MGGQGSGREKGSGRFIGKVSNKVRYGEKSMDIKITQVSFTRKFNLGGYETEDINFVATVADGQKPDEVLKALDAATVKYRKYQLSDKGK
jgi:hypothetical protein